MSFKDLKAIPLRRATIMTPRILKTELDMLSGNNSIFAKEYHIYDIKLKCVIKMMKKNLVECIINKVQYDELQAMFKDYGMEADFLRIEADLVI